MTCDSQTLDKVSTHVHGHVAASLPLGALFALTWPRCTVADEEVGRIFSSHYRAGNHSIAATELFGFSLWKGKTDWRNDRADSPK